MWLRLLALVFLSSVGDAHVAKAFKSRRQRRASGEGSWPSCPKGCERCSEYNGCVRCQAKLFMFLARSHLSQVGVCLASCPAGYFGVRVHGGNNRCSQCDVDCDVCFDRRFCIKCKEGLYLANGKCYATCPPGLHPADDTMECVECRLSEWSQWGACAKTGKPRGSKKATRSRVRRPLRPREPPSRTCAPQTQRRKCAAPKTPCKRAQEKKTEGGRPLSEAGGEGGGDGGGGGGRRRKGQSRTTVVPNVSTSSVT
ncbi:R-spondin-1 [Hippocampus zosterae]|uniref:R-spondin-1 n=1 Tax=Hippocampus zosterae TaxID=109293 RepID=UPI00223CF1C9|nr:R-spondin-1 [Hippocampus zosterae]